MLCNGLLYLMLHYVTVSVISDGLGSLTGSPWQPINYRIFQTVGLHLVGLVKVGADFIVRHGN